MAKFNLRPLDDRVVVQPTESAESTTAGGIVLPDSAQGKATTWHRCRRRPGQVAR